MDGGHSFQSIDGRHFKALMVKLVRPGGSKVEYVDVSRKHRGVVRKLAEGDA